MYNVCTHIYVCVCMYKFVYMGVYTCIYMYVCLCMFVVYYSDVDPIAQFDPVTEDPNLIWIRICRVPIRQAIRRPTYKMIRRFIPIRIVQTRRQFELNTVSFHVSVCSYVISLFTIVSRHLYITCFISYDRLIYFTNLIIDITS